MSQGLIETDDVRAQFERGVPTRIIAVVVFPNPAEWYRFMRFMKRYSAEHGLQFTAADM